MWSLWGRKCIKQTVRSLPGYPAFLPGDDFLFWNRVNSSLVPLRRWVQNFWVVEVGGICRVRVLRRGAIQETRGGCWEVQRFSWGSPISLWLRDELYKCWQEPAGPSSRLLLQAWGWIMDAWAAETGSHFGKYYSVCSILGSSLTSADNSRGSKRITWCSKSHALRVNAFQKKII